MDFNNFMKITNWKDIINNSRMVSVDDADIVDVISEREINSNGYSNILAFQLDPYYAVLGKNSKYRVLEIYHNEDIIYVYFKYVSFMKAQYIRLIGKPFSLLEDFSIEDEIFNHIIKYGLAKQIIDYPTDKYTGYNFYNYLDEINDFISKSKFRSKNGINKYIDDFKLVPTSYNDLNLINELNVYWQSSKKNLTDKRLVNGFLNYYVIADKRLKYYSLYYKDFLIGFTFGDIVLDDLFQIVVNRNITILDNDTLQSLFPSIFNELNERMKYLGAIHFYLLMRELKKDNMKIAYIGGGAVSDKLVQYKSKFYKHYGGYELKELN